MISMDLNIIIGRISVIFLVLVCATNAYTQEQENDHNSEEVDLLNKISATVGYAWVPSGSEVQGQSNVLVIPTLGIKYARSLSEKIAFAWTNEFEFSNYVIERSEAELLEREYAIVTAALLMYEPVEKLGLFAGPGVELEKNENFFVFKIGAEYSVKVLDDWFILIESYYDIKEVYGTFGLGLSIGSRF